MILPRNWCLIFFRDPQAEFTPARMTKALRDSGLTVTGREQPFSVDWATGSTMLVSIQRGTYIETVVRGLVGQRRQFRELVLGCDAQVKVELNNVDEALGEINTLIQVQSALQDATCGLMYMSWNHNLAGPTTQPALRTPRSGRRIHAPSTRKADSGRAGRAKKDPAGENKWLTSERPGYMAGTLLSGRLTERKMRLFACACCRQIWAHITDARSRALVELAEAFADGLVTDRQRGKAHTEAKSVPATRETHWLGAVSQTLEKQVTKYASLVGQNSAWTLAKDFSPDGRVTGSIDEPYKDQAEARQADLLRDIFSNPFQKIVMKKGWRTHRVVEIADAIYQERAFDRLPMLAEALSTAGCDDERILGHCRSEGPHVRGCWVVDMALGKE